MEKKKAIIESARNLFSTYGYKKVSMEEIAKEAGVTKKTVYSYFKDKDSIFLYFVDEELEKIKDDLEQYEKNNNSSFIEIVAHDIYHILHLRKNSSLITTVVKEAKKTNANICEKFIKVYDQNILNYLEEKINYEIKSKRIKKCDAHLISFIIYKVFLSIMFEYDENINEEQVAKEVTSILKEGILN